MRNIPRFQVRQSAAGAGVAPRRTRCCSITRHRRGDSLTDLPRRVPTMRDEVAIWRAFLSTEIDAIMRGEG